MDIVHRIPWQISNFEGTGVGGSYSLADNQFDYALGGIPFLSATRDQWPYQEKMAEIRKQQYDASAEPGEQSIYGWWLRSQQDFSGGAGLLYQDPDLQNPYLRSFDLRFGESLGVDPWTGGQLKLLRRSNNQATLTGAVNPVRGYVSSTGVDRAWYLDSSLYWSTDGTTNTSISWPLVGNPLGLASSGNRSLLLATDGVWSGVDQGAATKMYSPPAGTITTGAIEYVKARIGVAFNNSIYFAPIVTTGLPAALPTVTYTHNNPNWVWTSLTDGPNAIYAAGNDGTTGSIFKFTLDGTGGVPALTGGGAVTAQMPTGEQINTIYGYVGTFVGIATSKGFRVGEIDSNGDINYGPLLFTPTGGCRSIVGFDRFMWTCTTFAHDGQSGLYRVDLGTATQDQTTRIVRYAYARDIYATGETNAAQSVSMLGSSDRKVFSITSDSLWIEDASTLLPEGYLQTGRIRFNTEEPKLYKFISLRTPIPLTGEVQASVLDQGGGVTPYATYGPSFSPGSGDVSTPQPNGPQNWIALKFTLRRGSDTTLGGVLNGWQVKALPGSIRQRIITHTFLLFDEETDKGGQRIGYNDYARDRFESFKGLARAGDVVTFQELIEDLSTLVVIDDWQYTQTAPPGPDGAALGGYLTVQMRTVAESI